MVDPLLSALLLAWLRAACIVHGVDPEFATAVCIVESRPLNGGEMEMRVGPLGKSGKFVGPGGISVCFATDAKIYNPYINALIAVGALRGKDRTKVLKRYNTEYTPAYGREIAKITRRLKAKEAP